MKNLLNLLFFVLFTPFLCQSQLCQPQTQASGDKNWDEPWEEPIHFHFGIGGTTRSFWDSMTVITMVEKPGEAYFGEIKKGTHYSKFMVKKMGQLVLEVFENGDVYIDPNYFNSYKKGKERMKKVFNIYEKERATKQ